MTSGSSRVMIIGLDGATLPVLKRFVDEGYMPHLGQILEDGVYGELQSVYPPFSAVAWTSFATGKNPGKHGIFDFFKRTGNSTKVPVSSVDIRSKTLWDIASEHGKRVIVVNTPITYPPPRVNGIVVSDFLTTPGSDNEYTYPLAIKREIVRRFGDYQPAPFKVANKSVEFIDKVILWTRKSEEINQYLLNRYPWDLFINVFQGTDIIQHFFWEFLQPETSFEQENRYVAKLLEFYRLMDDILGKRRESLGNGTKLFLISDHGFTGLHTTIHLNYWLHQQGLLHYRQAGLVKGTLNKIGLSKRAIVEVLVRLDILKFIDKLPQERRWKLGRQLDQAIGCAIDWERTKAYAGEISEQGIHINLKGRELFGVVLPGEEYDGLIEEIIAGLSGLQDPRSRAQLFQGVFNRDDIYEGPYVQRAPDIVLDPSSGYMVDCQVSPACLLESTRVEAGTGRHDIAGFFAFVGKGISRQQGGSQKRLIDITPTVLYLLGVPVPSDLDGRVLVDILSQDLLSLHPVAYYEQTASSDAQPGQIYTEEDSRVIEERLKGLGYLG